jgi:hypothetical protein
LIATRGGIFLRSGQNHAENGPKTACRACRNWKFVDVVTFCVDISTYFLILSAVFDIVLAISSRNTTTASYGF